MRDTDVLIIGAGAAGLFCAIEAGKRGRNVVVLEHADRIGKKIAISGGGRCNFTNIHTTADNFISANPHFCKSALARYTPQDFIALVKRHGIRYHEKKLGQLFCDGSSREIIEMLLNECADAGVEIRCGSSVHEVKSTDDSGFEIQTANETFVCRSLVVATGGLSVPPLGATDFGYRLAKQFGLRIEEPRPGLVPFTLPPNLLNKLSPLSGLSVDAVVGCNGKEFRENILVTHRGLSGPAILQISSYWRPGMSININLLPDQNIVELLEEDTNRELELTNLLSRYVPRNFARAWCSLHLPSQPIKQLSPHQRKLVADGLHNWTIKPSGTEGYKKAEVTVGGVSPHELSSKTMEVKNVRGLYFIGEVVDVTGHLGGYNFQWAWASGYAAGQNA
jgi:predicted Rossmann fold flavoprotein